MKTILEQTLEQIRPLDERAKERAKARLLSLAKPPGSLGRLEDIAVQLAGIQRRERPVVAKPCVVVLCADNGVVAEGVASAPASVTHAQAVNMVRGITGVAVLARHFGSGLLVADVGIDADVTEPAILSCKIRKGTGNICKEPAMTRQEALLAVETGIRLAQRARAMGYGMLGVGEMGIGNTTTSSAVLCALAQVEPQACTGRGAGLSDDGYQKKLQVIAGALALHQPDSADPLDVLAKVGGLDIAAMCGVFLGAAALQVPVVVDGFISMVAALAAVRMQPLAAEYMLASHLSCEPGYRIAAKEIGLSPCLNMDMRLGEGSGCPLFFGMAKAACAVIAQMGTFGQGGIDMEYLEAVDAGADFSKGEALV